MNDMLKKTTFTANYIYDPKSAEYCRRVMKTL